ncbi:unnamed protein product [Pylaiella littoralis]
MMAAGFQDGKQRQKRKQSEDERHTAGAGRPSAAGVFAPAMCSPKNEDEDFSASAPPSRGLVQRTVSSIQSIFSAGITGTSSDPPVSERSKSDGTASTEPLSAEGSTNYLKSHQDHELFRHSSDFNQPYHRQAHSDREDDSERIVQQGGIKPGMGPKTFGLTRCPFRLHVQEDSVKNGQTSGPINVHRLDHCVNVECRKLKGVWEVECYPNKHRFDPPLLFDFLVESRDTDNLIIDNYGRIQYEVLTKKCGSNLWIRDPEGSAPLKIVKDNQGQIYVRAEIRHFSSWGLFKKIDLAPEEFAQHKLPWMQRRTHQSVIVNRTPRDVHIYAYVVPLSQWNASVKSVHTGVGVSEIQTSFDFSGDVHQEVHPQAKIPQMARISSGRSHSFEVPRVGAGVRSSRKAVVAIATYFDGVNGVPKMRLEAVVHLRSRMALTVTLDVDEEGKIKGSPVAEETGGILSQLMRAIENEANATPPSSARNADGRSPAAESGGIPSQSERAIQSNANSTPLSSAPTAGGRSSSDAYTTVTTWAFEQDGKLNSGTLSSRQPTASPAVEESKSAHNSPL